MEADQQERQRRLGDASGRGHGHGRAQVTGVIAGPQHVTRDAPLLGQDHQPGGVQELLQVNIVATLEADRGGDRRHGRAVTDKKVPAVG